MGDETTKVKRENTPHFKLIMRRHALLVFFVAAFIVCASLDDQIVPEDSTPFQLRDSKDVGSMLSGTSTGGSEELTLTLEDAIHDTYTKNNDIDNENAENADEEDYVDEEDNDRKRYILVQKKKKRRKLLRNRPKSLLIRP